jgi:riboflavin transporter FmnP
MKRITTRTISVIGILSAFAAGLMFIETLVPFTPGFLKLDVSELPVLLGTFALGPVAGIVIEALKNLIHFLMKSSTGGVGEIANFIVGTAFLVPAGIIYRLKKDKRHALLGMMAGTVSMAVVGAAVNYWFLIPVYVSVMGFPMEAIIGMGTAALPAITDLKTLILYGIVPFNLFKGIVISVLTLLIYKRVSPLLHKR